MLRVIKNQSNLEYNCYLGPHHQLSFQACWHPPLNNPLLNKLYKESICFTERWYLEVRSIINKGNWHHPLLQSIIYDSKLKTELVKSTIIDGALMRSVLTTNEFPQYQISASVNLKKTTKWCAFFTSLPNSIDVLVDLNDPTSY
jgi:hypothetical protein